MARSARTGAPPLTDIRAVLLILISSRLILPRRCLADAGANESSSSAAAIGAGGGDCLFDVCVRRDVGRYLAEAGLATEEVGRSEQATYPWKLESAEKQQEVESKSRQSTTRMTTTSSPIREHSCSIFAAESSIPGAGLGVYTARSLPLLASTPIGHPELALILVDFDRHPNVSASLLSDYLWASRGPIENGSFEGNSMQVMMPGVGTLMNTHPGLASGRVGSLLPRGTAAASAGASAGPPPRTLDRNVDPGAGAVSEHGDFPVLSSMMGSKSSNTIPAGAEVFTMYGPEWLVSRGFGDHPLKEDYDAADELIRSFVVRRKKSGSVRSDDWGEEWAQTLKGAIESSPRVRSLLPDDVAEAEAVSRTGSARHSLGPDSVRSDEWLRTNGHCMDNLYAGPSPIPQAGRGGFASRHFPAAAVIEMSPLIFVRRSDVDIYNTRRQRTGGTQQILNYCFGHPESSLMLFPYSSGVTLINHGERGTANARIRWSTSKYNKLDWLKDGINVNIAKKKAGLMIDVVATRDIEMGEEVLIDYGHDWEEAWEEHVKAWKGPLKETWTSPHAMNAMETPPAIRTIKEQRINPYPEHLGTVCLYEVDPDLDDPTVASRRWKLHGDGWVSDHWRPCDVTARRRVAIGGGSVTLHNVTIPVQKLDTGGLPRHEIKHNPHVVTMVPRWAIKFVDKPYHSNQHLEHAFRHPLGLPVGMYPDAWLDE